MQQPDDWYWRRPDPAESPVDPARAAERPGTAGWTEPTPPAGTDASGHHHAPSRYSGPPPMTAPPAGWQPARLAEPAPPRALPEQDHDRIDDDETRARRLTWLIGVIAGVVMTIALCAVCGRVVF